MSGYRELLLGCGYSRAKKVASPGNMAAEWRGLTTADINARCAPDWMMDMDKIAWRIHHPVMDLPPEYFDEIHAYEVFEHLGSQGDVRTFFATFNNVGYMLKAGGYLCATTPSRYSPWLWGDPGHRRAILPESLTFLCSDLVKNQPAGSPMSDYAGESKYDWTIVRSEDDRTNHRFILQRR